MAKKSTPKKKTKTTRKPKTKAKATTPGSTETKAENTQQELNFKKPPAETETAPRTTLVYLLPEQIELVKTIAAAANLKISAAAAPSAGSTATVADSLETTRCLDFRQQILSLNPDLILILTLDEIGNEEIALLRNQLTKPAVLTLEPLITNIADCPQYDTAAAIASVGRGLLLRATPLMSVFNDIRASFGTVRSINVAIRAHRMHGSLYARLTDAVDIMEYLCGTAEQVDAAMSGPLGEPPPNLRALHGHLTVNARFAENCCACIHVSDLGATWARGVTILGDAGCVRVTDQAFEWWDQAGKLVDSSARAINAKANPKAKTANFNPLTIPEAMIITETNRILAQTTTTNTATPTTTVSHSIPPSNPTLTIAACEAIRLSLHTGQSESPRKILELFESTH